MEADSHAVFTAASSLGFFAKGGRLDKQSRLLTNEVVGQLTEQRQRNFTTTVRQLLGEQELEVDYEA